jgi:predicted RNA-binding Zn-ribbon protein involved in translation (DUF1610 family)
MSKKTPRCDSCGRRIRLNQHEFFLRDFETGQAIGRYHAACQGAATKYLLSGTAAAYRGTYYHPPRCGGDLMRCDGGASEA